MQYITYLRVSTDRQGRSGLGLEAQRSAIEAFIRDNGGNIIQAFTEVETGKDDKRPELTKAIKLCRVYGAILLVAKLDRLSRNLHFLTGLMQSRVKFRCCDNPNANDLTIHILAAMAEYEREMISVRTKAALAAAKARGVKLGGMKKNLHKFNARDYRKLADAIADKADKAANDLSDIFEHLHSQGFVTATAKARELIRLKVPTARGGTWTPCQVIRYQDRLNPRC